MRIDDTVRGLVRLAFCEHNLILPIRLEGRRLTVLAANPNDVNTKITLGTLRTKYDVVVEQASAEEIRLAIDENYYSKCRRCGARVDRGLALCKACHVERMMGPAPAPPQHVSYAPELTDDFEPLIVLHGPQRVNQTGQVVPVEPKQVVFAEAIDAKTIGKNCPFCQTPIKPGAMSALCPECAIPHHADCWKQNRGCTTFGCIVSEAMTAARAQAGVAAAVPVQRPVQYLVPRQGGGLSTKQWIGAAAAIAFFVLLLIVSAGLSTGTSEADRHFNRGEGYISQGLRDQAETEYMAALREDPGFAAAHFGLALLRLGLDDHSTGVQPDSLAYRAARGDTLELAEIERSLFSCISASSSMPPGETVRGLNITHARLRGRAYQTLAFTAALRGLAALRGQQPVQTKNWARTARQYLSQSIASDPSPENRASAQSFENLVDRLEEAAEPVRIELPPSFPDFPDLPDYTPDYYPDPEDTEPDPVTPQVGDFE